jgi:hypothetical protein
MFMNTFSKQRFPKISLVLFIIGTLLLIAMVVRIMLGASINLPPRGADNQVNVFVEYIFPILVMGLSFLFFNLLLWLLLRKKGIRFMDLNYPISMLSAITIFVYFHFTLLA